MLELRCIHKVTNEKLEEIIGMKDVAYIIKKLKSEKGEKWNQKIYIGDHMINPETEADLLWDGEMKLSQKWDRIGRGEREIGKSKD